MVPAYDATIVDDYRWLLGAEAERILQDGTTAGLAPLALAGRLRKSISAQRARLIAEQLALRIKAREKFSRPGEMFFERTALAQATDEWIAHYKARRFEPGEPLADLCCGLGGDLLGLASRGAVRGIDHDPIKALLTNENCRRLMPRAAARVETADIADVDLKDYSAWHIDPDRRPSGKRTTAIDRYRPDGRAIDGLLRANRNAAIKVAAAARVPDHWSGEAQLEWISRAGECRQQVAWFGALAEQPGQRRATIIARDGSWLHSIAGVADLAAPVAPIGRFVYEPDAAILAARLVGQLAQKLGLARIAPDIAYLTSDKPIDDRGLAAFQVEEVLPFRIKHLKEILRARGIGDLEIKKRGVDLEPDRLRRQLAGPGLEAATIIVTRAGDRTVAILARRMNGRSAD